MSEESPAQEDLLGRMPRHRARGRSPHRAGVPHAPQRLRDQQPPFQPEPEESKPGVDETLLEGAQDAVRMAAEVVDIALVAAALAMREMVVRLNGRDAASGSQSSDPR